MNIIIDNKTYFDLFQLGKDLCLKPKVFSSQLYENEDLKRFIQDSDALKYQEYLKLINLNLDKDELLFRLAYIFNPYQNLKYHTYEFNSLTDLGKLIIQFAPKIDVYLKDLLTKGLLLHYIKINSYPINNPSLFKKIEDLTKLAKKKENLAYFCLGFSLFGVTNVNYEGVVYKNYSDFVNKIITNGYLKEHSDELEKNCFLFAFQIETYGNLDTYKRYIQLMRMFNDKKRRYEIEVTHNALKKR